LASGYNRVPVEEVSQEGLISAARWFIVHSWLRNSLHSPPTPDLMKLFASKFYQTLVLNIATISAIVVGTVQFLVRAYKDNNGPERTRKAIQTVLQFVDNIVEQLQAQINTDVPLVKVAHKSPKRR
jgi:hypothetical protein